MLEYSAFNEVVFAKVPENAINILDVGCGTGLMGKMLKQQNKNRVVNGITYSKNEYIIAKDVLDKVWISDINKEIPNTEISYDCIIFSHVLEHTFHPEKVLSDLSLNLKNGGTIIIALPNVLHFKQRIQFLYGNFQYSEQGGLMDITHFRFFDWTAAQKMIIDAGLEITDKEATGNFPLPVFRKIIPNISKILDKYFVTKWPGLFGFQFVFIANRI